MQNINCASVLLDYGRFPPTCGAHEKPTSTSTNPISHTLGGTLTRRNQLKSSAEGYIEAEDSSEDETEDDESEDTEILHEDFTTFKHRIRVEETLREEGNRRAGGIKMQKAVARARKVSKPS